MNRHLVSGLIAIIGAINTDKIKAEGVNALREVTEKFRSLRSNEPPTESMMTESANAIIEQMKAMDMSAGEVSDGYHTYNELYEHRMFLFSILCYIFKQHAWKSWRHDDGTMFTDMFIVGLTTPEGDYTYHFNKEHWDNFNARVLTHAPEWDGHKPEDITRLLSLLKTGKADD